MTTCAYYWDLLSVSEMDMNEVTEYLIDHCFRVVYGPSGLEYWG